MINVENIFQIGNAEDFEHTSWSTQALINDF